MSYLTDNIERLEEASITWNTVVQRMDVLFHEELFHSNGTASDPTMVIVRLLQELADRRKLDKPRDASVSHEELMEKAMHTNMANDGWTATTYDERDMMAEHGAWFGKEHPGDMQKGKVDWDARIAEQKQQLHEMGNPLWDLLERKKHQKEAQAWYESLVDVIPADAPKDWTSEDIVKGCDKCIYRVLPADIEYHYTGKCVQFHGQDVKVDESIPVDQMNMKREASRKHMDRLKEYMEKVSMVKRTLQTLKLADREPADIAKCEEELKKLHEWYRQSEPEAILVNPFAADHFYKLCRQIVELGLLAEDATDQMAFICLRDFLNDHAEQEKQAHNPAYRPFEEPSSKV